MRYLLVILTLFSGSILASPTCNFQNVYLKSPRITHGTEDGPLPQLISDVWFSSQNRVAVTCTDLTEVTSFRTLANIQNPSATAQDAFFEGKSYKLFLTDVEGVGLIMEVADINFDFKPVNSSETILWSSDNKSASANAGIRARAKFVATKHLPPGEVLLPGMTLLSTRMLLNYPSSNGYHSGGYIKVIDTTLETKYPACSLKHPNAVKLQLINSDSIRNINDAANEAAFNISLICGQGSNDLNVRYTLSDVYSQGNASSTLTLKPQTNSARGVALQILENGTPINYGPDSSQAGNLNQRAFGVMKKTGGAISNNFSVRYIRTDQIVVPGILEAGVTITMSYQ